MKRERRDLRGRGRWRPAEAAAPGRDVVATPAAAVRKSRLVGGTATRRPRGVVRRGERTTSSSSEKHGGWTTSSGGPVARTMILAPGGGAAVTPARRNGSSGGADERHWRRRRGTEAAPASGSDGDSGGGAVNGVEQLRGDASLDQSILDERRDFDELDDVVDSNEVGRLW
ncbi:hypothetical protein Scep_003667 [Stephania cephalantha]|uniref:Uncharacterized protein n=1 Tax=Stephania cephalantha TaxID=152367 RepID=A0AAP0KQY4_9MAGN